MENSQASTVIDPFDPEVQAGRTLRRLRLSQGWSQEEVATRMGAFGYDFHQTMIAKIEAAQRPLRVRELVDFATLFGVEINLLIQPPPNGSLDEITEEIEEVERELARLRHECADADKNLNQAMAVMSAAMEKRDSFRRDIAVLEGRLGFLANERNKLVHWETEQELP